jgi:hypothetical protein
MAANAMSPTSRIRHWWRTLTEALGFRRPPGYLREADYYRLGYQLLATRANRLVAAASEDDLRTAISDATRLHKQVQAVLDHFERHRAPARWPFWHRLDSQERRLRRFLATTVEPCVLLGIGVLEAEWDGGKGVRRAWRQLDTAPHRWFLQRRRWRPWRSAVRFRWSCRALLNLACLDGMAAKYLGAPQRRSPGDLCRLTGAAVDPRAKISDVVVGVWALEEALRDSQGEQRGMVLRAIDEDPTLAPLCGHPDARSDIQRLRERYASPPTPAPSSGSAVTATEASSAKGARRVWWRLGGATE